MGNLWDDIMGGVGHQFSRFGHFITAPRSVGAGTESAPGRAKAPWDDNWGTTAPAPLAPGGGSSTPSRGPYMTPQASADLGYSAPPPPPLNYTPYTPKEPQMPPRSSNWEEERSMMPPPGTYPRPGIYNDTSLGIYRQDTDAPLVDLGYQAPDPGLPGAGFTPTTDAMRAAIKAPAMEKPTVASKADELYAKLGAAIDTATGRATEVWNDASKMVNPFTRDSTSYAARTNAMRDTTRSNVAPMEENVRRRYAAMGRTGSAAEAAELAGVQSAAMGAMQTAQNGMDSDLDRNAADFDMRRLGVRAGLATGSYAGVDPYLSALGLATNTSLQDRITTLEEDMAPYKKGSLAASTKATEFGTKRGEVLLEGEKEAQAAGIDSVRAGTMLSQQQARAIAAELGPKLRALVAQGQLTEIEARNALYMLENQWWMVPMSFATAFLGGAAKFTGPALGKGA